MNTAKIKSTLLKAIHEAGMVVKSAFGKEQRITKKGEFNLVTEIDKAAEEAALKIIKKAFPNHSILAEESPKVEGSEAKWIIDPIDGTTNFAHGFPVVSVSIAFAVKGRLEMGGVLDPTRGELFFAQRGKGAFLNGRRIRASKTKTLLDSLVVTGFPYDRKKNPEDYLGMLRAFLTKVQCIRRTGSAAMDLCYVACGRFDGYYEMKLNPWDKAAGMLIVKEAGGKLTDFSGNALKLTSVQNLATNGTVHQEMLKTLKPFRKLGR